MEIRSSKYSFAALRQELNIQRKAIHAEVTKRSKAEFGQLQEKQEEIWIANGELARSPGHPFYQRLNDLIDSVKFDLFVEGLCRKFYALRMGRPSLAPGIYFRSLPIGYFEGIDSERGITWRPADSLALRQFVRISLTESTPDHSTISRTRRPIDVETHREVFGWVAGLAGGWWFAEGQAGGVDATTLEASAAMRSIRGRSVLRIRSG